MHRRTALTVTGAVALTLAAGSAAMAANLGILDRGNGVDVGDLSPVGSSSTVSTPATAPDDTSTTVDSTPTSIDDHGVDGPAGGHDDGIRGDRFDDDPGDDDGPRATTPASTPTTVDDHGGDRDGDDHSGPGRDRDDDDNRGHGGSGHGGGEDD
jgi:hypothetical protein